MAGSTAPTTVAPPGAGPRRGLWQAPVFVLGVGALAAVWLARPLLAHGDSASAARHQLNRAMQLIEHPEGDPADAVKAAQRVVDVKERHPELAAEADLTLGGALIRQAEQAEEPKAAELWAEARRRLEAADKEKVPEADRGRLQYRLGVVGFHTHDDPRQVVDRLQANIDQADDPVQGYAVLAQAWLNLPKPNLQEAQAANYKLRNLPQAPEDVLAPARLLGGELELKLGRPDEARRVLMNLGPKATPDMQARALRLCARSWQDESHWAEAAALWQKALEDGRLAGESLYNLGVCARRQDQNADAEHFWERCVQAGGDEGQAAAAELAELRLKGPDPDAALEMLTKVVDKVKPGAEWTNPLLDREAAVKLFQEAAKTYLDSHHFDAAVRLAEPFGRVAAPGEAAVLRAKASAEWARARQEEARQAGTPEARRDAEAAARELFRQASSAYAEAAGQAPATDQPGEYLWLGAHCSWEARDLEPAAAQLDKVLHVEVSEEQAKQDWYTQRQGEGWFLLGEARRALKDSDGAGDAYRECIKYSTTYAYHARYYLAEADVTAGNIDHAVDTLEQNLQYLRSDNDPEAHEKTLLALGDLYYKHGNYTKAVQSLKVALTAGRFPADPACTRAHYQLADSYRRLADKTILSAADAAQSPEKIGQKRKEYLDYLVNATDEFEGLAKLLESPEGKNLLTPEERVQVPFLAADCHFDQGDYSGALAAYERLATRYAERLEGLNALGGMVRCYSAQEEWEKKQKVCEQMDELLPKMPQEVRKPWTEWLKTARKPVSPP